MVAAAALLMCDRTLEHFAVSSHNIHKQLANQVLGNGRRPLSLASFLLLCTYVAFTLRLNILLVELSSTAK